MKLLIKFQEKVGVDRLLHFFVAAFLTALALPFGFLPVLFVAQAVVLLALAKEWIDDLEIKGAFDIVDFLWSFSGAYLIIFYAAAVCL